MGRQGGPCSLAGYPDSSEQVDSGACLARTTVRGATRAAATRSCFAHSSEEQPLSAKEVIGRSGSLR